MHRDYLSFLSCIQGYREGGLSGLQAAGIDPARLPPPPTLPSRSSHHCSQSTPQESHQPVQADNTSGTDSGIYPHPALTAALLSWANSNNDSSRAGAARSSNAGDSNGPPEQRKEGGVNGSATSSFSLSSSGLNNASGGNLSWVSSAPALLFSTLEDKPGIQQQHNGRPQAASGSGEALQRAWRAACGTDAVQGELHFSSSGYAGGANYGHEHCPKHCCLHNNALTSVLLHQLKTP
jgi:hypothetical protein